MEVTVMPQQETNTDVLVRLSHMNLWVLLCTVVFVGSAMVLALLGGPALAGMARSALILLPVAIAIAIAAIRMKAGRPGCATSPQMRAVMNDELRQHALSKAYRNGFFAAMVATVAVASILSFTGVERALAVMLVAVLTIGVGTMLASVLYYDR
jgi:hypothetical protein